MRSTFNQNLCRKLCCRRKYRKKIISDFKNVCNNIDSEINGNIFGSDDIDYGDLNINHINAYQRDYASAITNEQVCSAANNYSFAVNEWLS